MSNNEETLKKGNMSEVFRDGSVVYRDLKPQSKSIHRLLLHLETKGILFVPRFLGVDAENKEMLSFVEGETIEDYPVREDIESRIITVQLSAKMLRYYHDATVDFERSPNDIWFLKYEGELPAEVICHNDYAPYNVTFNGFRPIGIIDFDTACPAPRIWDVAYAVYRFVPLGADIYDPCTKKYRKYDKTLDCSERKLLLKTFLESYGMENAFEVLQNVIMRLQALVKLFDDECQKGNGAFVKMKAEGHQKFYVDEISFIKENMCDWL
jgi:tRNA A-37 threonylcarbamoyl transferase component Bud32